MLETRSCTWLAGTISGLLARMTHTLTPAASTTHALYRSCLTVTIPLSRTVTFNVEWTDAATKRWPYFTENNIRTTYLNTEWITRLPITDLYVDGIDQNIQHWLQSCVNWKILTSTRSDLTRIQPSNDWRQRWVIWQVYYPVMIDVNEKRSDKNTTQ